MAAAAGTVGATNAAAARAGAVLALFALTATPARKTPDALLQSLAAPRPFAAKRAVVLDEQVFRARVVGRDGVGRRTQRRTAWSALRQDSGQTACFIDLSDAAETHAAAAGGGGNRVRRPSP